MKIVIFLMGLFGLFAQAFNGYIVSGVLVASLSAIALALFDMVFGKKPTLLKWLAIFLTGVAVLASVYDVFDYYSHLHAAGNSYGAWIWSVPLCICLFVYTKQRFLSINHQTQP